MTPGSRAVHDDPGLQPERTVLAWNRTTLAVAAVGLLALRLGAQRGVDVSALVGAVIGMVLLVVANQSRRHRRSVMGIASGRVEPSTSAVLGVGIGSLLLGLTTLVLIIAHRG